MKHKELLLQIAEILFFIFNTIIVCFYYTAIGFYLIGIGIIFFLTSYYFSHFNSDSYKEQSQSFTFCNIFYTSLASIAAILFFILSVVNVVYIELLLMTITFYFLTLILAVCHIGFLLIYNIYKNFMHSTAKLDKRKEKLEQEEHKLYEISKEKNFPINDMDCFRIADELRKSIYELYTNKFEYHLCKAIPPILSKTIKTINITLSGKQKKEFILLIREFYQHYLNDIKDFNYINNPYILNPIKVNNEFFSTQHLDWVITSISKIIKILDKYHNMNNIEIQNFSFLYQLFFHFANIPIEKANQVDTYSYSHSLKIREEQILEKHIETISKYLIVFLKYFKGCSEQMQQLAEAFWGYENLFHYSTLPVSEFENIIQLYFLGLNIIKDIYDQSKSKYHTSAIKNITQLCNILSIIKSLKLEIKNIEPNFIKSLYFIIKALLIQKYRQKVLHFKIAENLYSQLQLALIHAAYCLCYTPEPQKYFPLYKQFFNTTKDIFELQDAMLIQYKAIFVMIKKLKQFFYYKDKLTYINLTLSFLATILPIYSSSATLIIRFIARHPEAILFLWEPLNIELLLSIWCMAQSKYQILFLELFQTVLLAILNSQNKTLQKQILQSFIKSSRPSLRKNAAYTGYMVGINHACFLYYLLPESIPQENENLKTILTILKKFTQSNNDFRELENLVDVLITHQFLKRNEKRLDPEVDPEVKKVFYDEIQSLLNQDTLKEKTQQLCDILSHTQTDSQQNPICFSYFSYLKELVQKQASIALNTIFINNFSYKSTKVFLITLIKQQYTQEFRLTKLCKISNKPKSEKIETSKIISRNSLFPGNKRIPKHKIFKPLHNPKPLILKSG